MTTRLFPLLLALVLISARQLIAVQAPIEADALKQSIQLHVARNGHEVLVAWTMPASIQGAAFELYRNTHKDANGRTRLRSVKTNPPLYRDSVPNAETTYWYWIKVTLAGGNVINIGPVSTPSPEVWVP